MVEALSHIYREFTYAYSTVTVHACSIIYIHRELLVPTTLSTLPVLMAMLMTLSMLQMAHDDLQLFVHIIMSRRLILFEMYTYTNSRFCNRTRMRMVR